MAKPRKNVVRIDVAVLKLYLNCCRSRLKVLGLFMVPEFQLLGFTSKLQGNIVHSPKKHILAIGITRFEQSLVPIGRAM